VIREIPVYDSTEAKLITKNCAVDVVSVNTTKISAPNVPVLLKRKTMMMHKVPRCPLLPLSSVLKL